MNLALFLIGKMMEVRGKKITLAHYFWLDFTDLKRL